LHVPHHVLRDAHALRHGHNLCCCILLSIRSEGL
jgi:hypothetical protein